MGHYEEHVKDRTAEQILETVGGGIGQKSNFPANTTLPETGPSKVALYSLTGYANSPFHAEPAHDQQNGAYRASFLRRWGFEARLAPLDSHPSPHKSNVSAPEVSPHRSL